MEHPAPPVMPDDILKVRGKNDSKTLKTKVADKVGREKGWNFLDESESENHSK